TDAAGHYSIQLPTGFYTLTASAYGYADGSESGVSIADGAAITRNVTLTALPLRTISGRVTDAGHGYPLYASLEFTKALAPVWADPLTGHYTVTLIDGYTYTVSANAWTLGFVPYAQAFDPLAGAAELNIALTADPGACQAPGYSAGTGQCLPLSGGLLVGSTYGPDGVPLVGVGVGSGSFATSSAGTIDPAVPDAFYNLFLPPGTQVVTATSTGLPAIAAAVVMTDKSVLQHDFDWHAVYTDASLKQLSIGSGTLTPQFSSAVLSYDTEVAADVSSVDLLFAPGQPGAAVSVNGIPQDLDAAATVELRTGTNVVTIVVVALDGVTTQMYTIRIVRMPWPNYLYLPNVSR
ncbi:MAG: cadherin-like beta sandwich domain-containing protein, partial [Caldilineaceae bacterium]